MKELSEAAAWRRVAAIIRRKVAAGLDPLDYWRVGICHEVDELEQFKRISGETYELMKDKLQAGATPIRQKRGYWWSNTAKGCEKRIAWCLAQAEKCSKRRAK